MGYSNNIITIPVNTDDVCSALGVSSHDVATLCTHDKINKAALFRPRYSSTNPGLRLRGTDGKFLAAAQAEISGNISQRPQTYYVCPAYGVWVPELPINSQSGSTLIQNIFTRCTKEWYIAPPDKGGTASFKILDHFDGYYAKAKVTKPIVTASVSKRTAGGFTISVTLTTPAPDNRTMSVSNLFPNHYFGALVYRTTNMEVGAWNANDWQTQMVLASSTPIDGDVSPTSVQLTADDTSANNSSQYKYIIIPFVSSARIVNGVLTDKSYYGIKIDSTCESFLEKKTTSSSTTTEPGVQFFNFQEGNIKTYYPDDKQTPYQSGVARDISIAYSEITESKYAYNTATGMTSYNRLLNKYHRIEFHFNVSASGGSSSGGEFIYVWQKSGVDPNYDSITRDTRYDNNGSYENELLFYIPTRGFWNTIAAQVGTSMLTIDDMFGRFYYKNSAGNEVFEDTWAVEIPDTSN